MRFLRENTATRITVGPFLDVTDGFTPELALTVTGIHLTLVVDDLGVPTLSLDADAAGSGSDNDMLHITNDNAGFYDLELSAANVNFTGRAIFAAIDDSEHLPVFHEFHILRANVYDSLVIDGDLLDVTVIGAVASVSGNVDGSVGSVAGNVDGSVGSVAGNVDGSVASNVELGPSEVQAQVDAALVTARLDELLIADSDIDGAAPPVVGSVFHELMTKTAGSFTYDQTTDALEAVRDHIGDGTNLTEAGGDGAQLTAIDLPDQTMNITGNLSGSIGSNTELGPSEVASEMSDALRVDTLTATPVGAPPTLPTVMQALMVVYDALVHKVDVDATAKEFYNNAGTLIWQKALSDDASNYVEAESTSG